MTDTAAVYQAWDQTRLVKSKVLTGSMAVNYQEELIRTHAVPVEDGIAADTTVCGVPVRGNPYGAFDMTPLVNRCATCAEPIGVGHIGR